MNASKLGIIPNIVRGKNNTAHKVIPTINPRYTPLLTLYGINFLQNNAICPNMLPATVPVNICNPRPMYWAEAGSLNPSDNPITAKKVPGGVPDAASTNTNSPDIAHADIKPARVQDTINIFGVFCHSI